MKKEISCRVTNSVLRYVESRKESVNGFLEGFRVDSRFLRDTNNWISLEKAEALLRRAEMHYKTPGLAFEIGQKAVELDALGALTTILRVTGNTRQVFERTPKLLSHIDRVSTLEVLRISDTNALIELRPADGYRQAKQTCEYLAGLFSAFPTLWEQPPATIEHVQCSADLGSDLLIDNKRYFSGEDGSFYYEPLDNPGQKEWAGLISEEGTFEIDGVSYGAQSCIYRITWDEEAADSSFFKLGRWRQKTVERIEIDLRTIEEKYDELYRLNSQLEKIVSERTEQLSAKKQELEETNIALTEANKRKGEFMARMSHELRTPINAIIGFSNLLLEGIHGELTPKQTKSIARIEANTRNLLNIINDVLDLSKIQAGKMRLQLDPVNIREVCESSLSTVSSLSDPKGLELKLNMDPNTPATLITDKTKFKQILLNLLSNAIKFTDSGSVELEVYPENGITFSINDTGSGIDPKDFKHLFESFTPIAREEASGMRGSGLGLSITKQLLEALDGDIVVTSELGVGSQFSFNLPWEASSSNDNTESDIDAKTRGALDSERIKKQIMIIETDPEMIDFLELVIEGEGFAVNICREVDEALETARAISPDAIILEPMLPHKDGWVLLRELKANPKTSNIPVIILSVIQEPALAQSLGAVTSFSKPVERAQLIETLIHLTSQNKH